MMFFENKLFKGISEKDDTAETRKKSIKMLCYALML